MKNIYSKAFLKAVAVMFSAVLVFTSSTTSTTGELNGHEWVDLGLSVSGLPVMSAPLSLQSTVITMPGAR